jgi:hypothetical protein
VLFIHSFIYLQSINPIYSHKAKQDVDLVDVDFGCGEVDPLLIQLIDEIT